MRKFIFFFISMSMLLFAYTVEDGTEAMLEGNYAKGAKVWRSLLNNNPGNINYSYNLALCYEHLGLLEKAVYYYKRSISINPVKVKNKIAKLEKLIEERKKEEEKKKKLIEKEKNKKSSLSLATKCGTTVGKKNSFYPTTLLPPSQYKKETSKRPVLYGLLLTGFMLITLFSTIYIIKKKKSAKKIPTFQSEWQKLSLLLKDKNINGMYTFRENEAIGVIFFVNGTVASAYYTTLEDGITIKGENALELITDMKNPEIKFVPHVKDSSIEKVHRRPKKVVNIFDD